MSEAVHLHLVEVSERLSEVQKQALCVPSSNNSLDGSEESGCYKSCVSKYGPKVSWYSSLSKVPTGLAFYVAHEFFDALPIHKFQVS